MRIVFFSSSTTSSGGVRQAVYTLQELDKKGYNTAFIIPKHSSIINKADNINWVELPREVRSWKDFFCKFINDFNPNIIHVYHNKAIKKMAWWGLFLKGKNRRILAHRGVVFRPNNPLPYWSPAIDCFTVNSIACGNKLRQIGVPKRKIKLLYNCIPLERVASNIEKDRLLEQLNLSKEDVVIGSISGNAPYKGVEILLRAVSLLKNNKWKLILLGPSEEKWLPIIQKLNIEDRVIFLGHRNNVADYLQLMDIFCIPSLSESMPNTLLEAVFFELPIVASAVGGIPEILQGKGILFPPGDFVQLASNLEKLILSQNYRVELKNKVASLKGLFLPQAKVKKILEIYSNLLES